MPRVRLLQMNFAHFVMRAWQFCSPGEHKFIRLFLSVLLDKMDTEAYRSVALPSSGHTVPVD